MNTLVQIFKKIPEIIKKIPGSLMRVFDRLFAYNAVKQLFWVLMGIMGLLAVFAFFSWLIDYAEKPNFFTHLREILYLFIYPDYFDNFDKVPHGGKWAFYTLALIVGTLVVGGLLISVFTNMLQSRMQRVREGHVHYPDLDGHIVVIGYDEIVPNLICQIISEEIKRNGKGKNSYVLVQSMLPSQEVRSAIFALTEDKYENHILIYNGRRDSLDDLKKLNVDRAKEVYLIGDRSSREHDMLNIACMNQLVKILEKSRGPQSKPCAKLPFTVLFEDRATTQAFESSRFTNQYKDYLTLHPFNFYDNWSWNALASEEFFEPPMARLDRGDDNGASGITIDSERTAHLVIVGMSRMGVALAIQASQLMIYPNFKPGNGRVSIITFIDTDVDTQMAVFMSQYAAFFEVQTAYYRDCSSGIGDRQTVAWESGQTRFRDFVGVHFEFVKGDVYSVPVRSLLDSWASDLGQSLTLAVCLNNSRLNASIALNLPNSYYNLDRNIPILVRQRSSGELLETLAGENERFSNLKPFGMVECDYLLYKLVEPRAKVLNYAYKKAQIDVPVEADADLYWSDLSTEKRLSSIQGVIYITTKLRSLGIDPQHCPAEFSDETIADSVEIEHRRWVCERLLRGFRQGTPKKSWDRRHPCVAPNEEVRKLPQLTDDKTHMGQYELNDRATMAAVPEIIKIKNQQWRER